MTDLKSLLHSYLVLRNLNRKIDTEGYYSEGVCVLGRALKEYGIDVFNDDEVRAAIKRVK